MCANGQRCYLILRHRAMKRRRGSREMGPCEHDWLRQSIEPTRDATPHHGRNEGPLELLAVSHLPIKVAQSIHELCINN